MSRKRSKHQVISQILRTCIGKGAIKTRIVYTTNMNFHTINSYLITLIESGSIEITRYPRVTYRTTEKGLEALEHFEALEKLIPGLKEQYCDAKNLNASFSALHILDSILRSILQKEFSR